MIHPENVEPAPPYGFIQWKGTDVCLDLNCECGELSHVDADFLYFVRCPHCSRVYELYSFVRLLPVAESDAEKHSNGIVTATVCR